MYERILVALDGSELAEQILPHAEALAAKFGATLTLLRATSSAGMVVSGTTGVGVVGEVPMDPTPIVEAERAEAEAYLRAHAERLRQGGLVVHEEHLEGPAAELVLRRAAELGVDLIAMTTLGRGGLGRLVFGSVADEVLRHAACPVLLVKVGEETRAPVGVPVI